MMFIAVKVARHRRRMLLLTLGKGAVKSIASAAVGIVI